MIRNDSVPERSESLLMKETFGLKPCGRRAREREGGGGEGVFVVIFSMVLEEPEA